MSSWLEMKAALSRHLAGREREPLRILDVGAMAVNPKFPRTYREHMAPAWVYRGCDVSHGPNVDLVQVAAYVIQERGEDYDVVISGQCLEHVQWPWVLMGEMARVLRPGGLLIATTPWHWGIHRYPLDCWRVLPDGWQALFAWAGLHGVQTYTKGRDSWGIARKPNSHAGSG